MFVIQVDCNRKRKYKYMTICELIEKGAGEEQDGSHYLTRGPWASDLTSSAYEK